MRLVVRLFAAVAVGLTAASAWAENTAPATDAATAWQAIEEFRRHAPNPLQLPPQEAVVRNEAFARESVARLEAFIAAYPHDPLRWQAIAKLRRQAPLFILTPGPDPRRPLDGAKIDEAARDAFAARVLAAEQALLAAPDASAALKLTVEHDQIYRRMRVLAHRGRAAPRADWDEMVATVADFAARHTATPEDRQVGAQLINQTVGAFENLHGAAAAVDYWSRFVDSPEPRLAELARGKLAARAQFAAPLEIAFTAVDGRPVDLRQLRGKVVLVDFWATWCTPCIAELPNVRKVYAAYHDRGFEVVGIALENPNFRPSDTPEQQATKLAAAKRKLQDFVAKNELPWPQHFDGKWWQNEISKRFGISAIPAMLLLDQSGRVVTTDARGSKLESEVKRLLGL